MRPIHVRVVNGSIARIASHIDDPVRRLRFLSTVAPGTVTEKHWWRRRRRWVYAGLLILAIPISALWLLKGAAGAPAPRRAPPASNRVSPLPARAASEVWLVDRSAESEVYSNGLRIDCRFAISTRRREYLAFPRDARDRGSGVWRSEPAGIVFHTTESRLAPFDPSENSVLKRLGQSLLEYVRSKRAYHYLIDRFGRVYRVVPESDAANHAGYSVWADGRWLYLNLNESFLGVSFESQTLPGQTVGQFSPAQERSGVMLVEMLRSRYRIAPENCVTHAQVSVNPRNMRVGYHTDWASGFPFERFGLPDNYRLEPPALWAFGFESDSSYLDTAGDRIYPAIAAAEERLRHRADEAGVKVAVYRRSLQRRYREWLQEVRRSVGREEEAGN